MAPDPNYFYNLNNDKQRGILFEMLQEAANERKILAQNQKNIHSLIDTLGFLSVDSVSSWNGLSEPYKVNSL